ncbi:MAG: universal stress protein [Sphingobium sp.]|nr:universal stress protein [Sphingobium sp.]MCP5400096.1 universal stress protein [Sphingomonas sp.]
MKNILLLVHEDDGQEARLQAALDITRATGGHLTCLDVFTPPTIYVDMYGGGGGAVLIEQDAQQQAGQNRTALKERLAHEDVSWSWQEARGDLAREVTSAAELADLIVLNSHFENFDYPDPVRVATNVVIQSGRPVLAVPDSCNGIVAAGRAMIAWDGSGPAANAMKAALPLLKLASDVTLFEVGEPDANYPATEAATYLSRHEVHAKVLGGDRDRTTVAEAILERGHHADAAYIVMGAFGHSPATEAIFGGVTRSMLTMSDMPLLLAH